MKKLRKKITPKPMHYSDKKPFFSDKEIIFRSNGRARVWNISSKLQLITLILVIFVAVWSGYSYHMYHRSGRIITRKNNELTATRDAYTNLMGDFVVLQSNIAQMIKNLDEEKGKKVNVEQYKQQASLVEEKVKQITSQSELIDPSKLEEKANLNEVSLQRDIAVSERDELRRRLVEMQRMVEDIRKAEMDVLDKVSQIAEREMGKIKSAISAINAPLRKRGLYFNAMANNKKQRGSGGPYIPAENTFLQEKKVGDKVSRLYETVDDVSYYREVLKYIPMGKPVWSLWVSSPYGVRSDPFKKTKAYHKGVDLAGRTGNKIKTMAKGKVIKVEYNKSYGNLVMIDHGNGFVTKYAHMHKAYVQKGQHLEIGDAVGEMGSTGRSTGPHLHYEILYQGKDVDPMPFIKAKAS